MMHRPSLSSASIAPVRLLAGLILALLLLGPAPSIAQPTAPSVTSTSPAIRLTLSGGIQTRASYSWLSNVGGEDTPNRLGAGIRRARFRVLAEVGPRTSVFMQLEGTGPTFLDFWAAYQWNERVRLRLGRFISAQPRSFIQTGMPYIDAVARPAIAERWGAQTLGSDGRDFGLEAQLRFEEAELLLYLHNGDGNWNRARGNVREDISGGDVLRGVDNVGLAASVSGVVRPASVEGLEAGAFVSYNASKNPNTEAFDIGRSYGSYGAHVYWGARPGSQPVRLKADLLGIRYQTLDLGAQNFEQQVLGLAVLAAGRLSPASEAFVRVEHYNPNTEAGGDISERFVTFGATYSLSAHQGQPFHRQRVTLAYSGLFPEDGDLPRQHQVILQFQVWF